MDHLPSRSRGRLFILAAGILWSLGGVVTKSLPLDPLTIALYRGVFAGLALLPLVPRRRWVFRPMMIPSVSIFGAMTACYLGAVKTTTAANAIYLQCTATFWVVPLGLVFLGERPDRRAEVGIVLAMLGIAVIVGWGYDGRPDEWRGIALGLASGLGFAVVSTGLRGLARPRPDLAERCIQPSGGLALGLGIALSGRAIGLPTPPQMFALLAFGVVQMALPYMLFARGLREIGTAEAGLIAPDRTDPEPDLGRAGRGRMAGDSDADRRVFPAWRRCLPLLAAPGRSAASRPRTWLKRPAPSVPLGRRIRAWLTAMSPLEWSLTVG